MRRERALAVTFTQVLALCARAGLASVGLVALDGSLIAGSASAAQTRGYRAIGEVVEAILDEAATAATLHHLSRVGGCSRASAPRVPRLPREGTCSPRWRSVRRYE